MLWENMLAKTMMRTYFDIMADSWVVERSIVRFE